MNTLTIGRLAEQVAVSTGTVRYYERRVLIPRPSRSISGYREYSHGTVKRIVIKHAKELSFSLNEILELMSLRFDPGTSCSEIKARVEAKMEDIGERIKGLQKIKKALVSLTKACTRRSPVNKCPIFEVMDDQKVRRYAS